MSLLSKKQDISIHDVSRYFNKPIDEASRELGICVTLLKRVCRKNGIARWPHRRLKYLDRRLLDYQSLPTLSADAKEEVERLKKARGEVLNGLKVELTVTAEESWNPPQPSAHEFIHRVHQSPMLMQQQMLGQPGTSMMPVPMYMKAQPQLMQMSPVMPLQLQQMQMQQAQAQAQAQQAFNTPLGSRTYPILADRVDVGYLVNRFVDFGAKIRASMLQARSQQQ